MRAWVCLSLSRRRAIKLAMAVGLPIPEKVDKSPEGKMPSSSSRTRVGNLLLVFVVEINCDDDCDYNNDCVRSSMFCLIL